MDKDKDKELLKSIKIYNTISRILDGDIKRPIFLLNSEYLDKIFKKPAVEIILEKI